MGTSDVFRYQTVATFKRGARVKVDERIIVGALERLVDEGLLVAGTRAPFRTHFPQATRGSLKRTAASLTTAKR